MKLEAFCIHLQKIKTLTCKRSSVAHYQKMCQYILDYFGSEREIHTITPIDLENFLLYLHFEARKRNGEPLSDATRKGIANCLKHVFEEASRKDVIPQNPMLKVTKMRFRIPKARSFSPPELETIKEELLTHSLQWRVFVVLLLTTGKRRGEILALEWSDISFRDSSISISKSYNYVSGYEPFLSSTKSEKASQVCVPERVMLELLQLYEQHLRQASEKKIDPPSPLFFNWRTEKRIHPTSATHFMMKLSKKLGFRIYAHKFRHTMASMLFQAGVTAEHVASQLDHSDPSFTLKTYVHCYDKHSLVRENLNAIQNLY